LSAGDGTAIMSPVPRQWGRLLFTGPETRPALSHCEVAVVVVSEERFSATWSGRTAVVTAAGEIDLTNAEGLRDALLGALNAGALGLIVDLTATTFLDSAGVTALVRASRRAAASEATLRLAVTTPAVLRVLNLVGIDRMLEVHPSVADAVASLPAQLTVIDSSTHTPSGPDATET
jgi:anti-sigma B factor antagonist